MGMTINSIQGLGPRARKQIAETMRSRNSAESPEPFHAPEATKETLRLVLPYPPSANRYWRMIVINESARIVVSREAREYKKRVAGFVAKRVATPLQGRLRASLLFYRPRKIGNLDNRIKVLLDALNGCAYADDEQIVCILAHRYEDKENPRVEIVIEEL